jgi:multiple sugar transport system ATP-binding protein
MARLELEDVTKEFQDGDGTIVAVNDLSLDIPDGEFLVLVGPSGCGKSTTLRMVAGLEDITAGEIRLGDRVLNDVETQERNIAMVFQSYALYPHKTVRGNMSFGLEESTDLTRPEIDERVEETAAMMGIGDLLDRKPNELSGGQQQRVALGRAIVRDPDVFLMDEPLSNLDAKLRAEMRTELQHLQDELGVTTVYVTHDQTEAMTMGDRIAVLDGGELQQVGTPLECYDSPNNLFVAGFIGEPSMNFFEVRRENDALVSGGFEYPLTNGTADQVGGSNDLVLGIRPEHVRLHADGTGTYRFAADVEVVEPHGDQNVVHLAFAGGTGSERFTALTGGTFTFDEGERVVVEFPEEEIHLFDEGSGEAVVDRDITTADPPGKRRQ